MSKVKLTDRPSFEEFNAAMRSSRMVFNGVTYIRADIVDELVEALKICLAGNGYDFDERPAEAALKKLEESHD